MDYRAKGEKQSPDRLEQTVCHDLLISCNIPLSSVVATVHNPSASPPAAGNTAAGAAGTVAAGDTAALAAVRVARTAVMDIDSVGNLAYLAASPRKRRGQELDRRRQPRWQP